jgi:hypothetical protein
MPGGLVAEVSFLVVRCSFYYLTMSLCYAVILGMKSAYGTSGFGYWEGVNLIPL